MRVAWTDDALEDIEATYDYLARFNPVAAQRVAEALFIAGDSLAVFPHRGRIGIRPDTRELLSVQPYVIVYRIIGEEVQILRVWHGAQDRT